LARARNLRRHRRIERMEDRLSEEVARGNRVLCFTFNTGDCNEQPSLAPRVSVRGDPLSVAMFEHLPFDSALELMLASGAFGLPDVLDAYQPPQGNGAAAAAAVNDDDNNNNSMSLDNQSDSGDDDDDGEKPAAAPAGTQATRALAEFYSTIDLQLMEVVHNSQNPSARSMERVLHRLMDKSPHAHISDRVADNKKAPNDRDIGKAIRRMRAESAHKDPVDKMADGKQITLVRRVGALQAAAADADDAAAAAPALRPLKRGMLVGMTLPAATVIAHMSRKYGAAAAAANNNNNNNNNNKKKGAAGPNKKAVPPASNDAMRQLVAAPLPARLDDDNESEAARVLNKLS
jgi:hypothetical protein